MTNASEYQWTQRRGCKDIWAQASPWSEQHSVHGKAQHGNHGGSQTGSHPEGRSLQVCLVHVSVDHREGKRQINTRSQIIEEGSWTRLNAHSQEKERKCWRHSRVEKNSNKAKKKKKDSKKRYLGGQKCQKWFEARKNLKKRKDEGLFWGKNWKKRGWMKIVWFFFLGTEG